MTSASDCDVRARSVCSDLRLRHAKAGPATSSTSIMGELSECLWWHFLLSPVTYQHNYQYRFAILETARILFASTNCQRNFFSSKRSGGVTRNVHIANYSGRQRDASNISRRVSCFNHSRHSAQIGHSKLINKCAHRRSDMASQLIAPCLSSYLSRKKNALHLF